MRLRRRRFLGFLAAALAAPAALVTASRNTLPKVRTIHRADLWSGAVVRDPVDPNCLRAETGPQGGFLMTTEDHDRFVRRLASARFPDRAINPYLSRAYKRRLRVAAFKRWLRLA